MWYFRFDDNHIGLPGLPGTRYMLLVIDNILIWVEKVRKRHAQRAPSKWQPDSAVWRISAALATGSNAAHLISTMKHASLPTVCYALTNFASITDQPWYTVGGCRVITTHPDIVTLPVQKSEYKAFLHSFRVVHKSPYDTVIRGKWGYRLPNTYDAAFERCHTVTYDFLFLT